MKKILLIIPIVLLLAASCNSQSNIEPIINTNSTSVSNTDQQSDASQQNSPLTWKTFNAKTEKYTFQYPSNWYLSGDIADEKDPHISNKQIGDRLVDGQVVVEIQANEKKDPKVDLMTAFKQYTGYNGGGMNSSGKINETTINGYKAIQVEYSGGEGPAGPGYYIQRDASRVFYVLVYGTSEQDIVNKIVSSITFTK